MPQLKPWGQIGPDDPCRSAQGGDLGPASVIGILPAVNRRLLLLPEASGPQSDSPAVTTGLGVPVQVIA